MKIVWVILCLVLTLAVCMGDEALVEKDTGNVIIIKPDGAVWGRMETNSAHFIVVKIEDAELLARYAAKYGKDKPSNAHLAYPYAVKALVSESGEIVERITNASSYKVNWKANKALYKKGEKDFATNTVVDVAP